MDIDGAHEPGGSMLTDSTRTTHVGGSTIDFSLHSDNTSDISSNHHQQGSLADYQLHQLIGRGKYSQVYAATHIPTGMQVAMKKVAIFDMMDPQARVDCLKEVKILQSLEHPNIVKCYNSFIQDNELVIILEWAEAGDLGHLLRERAAAGSGFEPGQVWSFFSQICHAMKHMHDRRMMHRDLKPGNIFVAADGSLKLGDLGLSRYFSSRTLQAVTTVGTPYYMSPECIRGTPYDFSSDVWSLGCLLYELVALRNPFYKENQSLYALGKHITSCTYDPLPGAVPQPLRDLVTAMLQPQPQQRPTVAQLVQICQQHCPQPGS
uniref:non-specific serine/threonine protein kinase n=1 Tax=Chlamydomonas leiostraca TaxID=1034604 RepID=A0A7S0RG92_9CHLO|mmetsp:Transcript_22262/g.56638  ORF Transcript_22262/g.56638 Transcript_22262/m.56638 type:complete len:320 (+) Transcript_22262:87-1046(+)